MSQNQLISLLVGTKAAEAQGLTGDALSRAKLISLVVGNPVVSLLAVRAMHNSEPSDGGGKGTCNSVADAVAASKEEALIATDAASEANLSVIDARDAAARADLSAKAAAKSVEDANLIIVTKKQG